MARELTMPKLSDSMEEATILHWLKEPGEPFARGEPLAEIETDKATVVYEAETDGVLGEHPRRPRAAAARHRRADRAPRRRAAAEAAPERATRRHRVARRRAVELGVSLHELEGTRPGGRITVDDVEAAAGDQPAPRAQARRARGEVETVELDARRRRRSPGGWSRRRRSPTFMVTIEIDMSTRRRSAAREPRGRRRR